MEEASKNRRNGPLVNSSNLSSRFMFLYMFPLFKRSYRNGVQEEDLQRLPSEYSSSVLGQKLENLWKQEHAKNPKSSLRRALLKLFLPQLIFSGIVKLISDLIGVVATSKAIGNLTMFFEAHASQTDAYINTAIIIFAFLANAFLFHASLGSVDLLAFKVKISCSALIYRKLLKLDATALGQTTPGQIVNLLSNDVDKFGQEVALINSIWGALIQTVVAAYMLYVEIGISGCVGIALVVSVVPLQIWLGKRSYNLRKKVAAYADKRIRLMNDMIKGIQVIKMYCWDILFEQLISRQRRQEIKQICLKNCTFGFMSSFNLFLGRVATFGSIVCYIFLGNIITPKSLFTVIAIYASIRLSFSEGFWKSIKVLVEINVGIKRIEKLLSLREQTPYKQNAARQEPELILENVNAKWSKNSSNNTLKNVSFKISPKEPVTITGAVGSGKSSLFNVILQELPIDNGLIKVHGTISYCPQEAWLVNDTIFHNILLGSIYDHERYQKVLEACALVPDLKLLPLGDKTLVGERGKSLSGGQKARITLARCLYRKADIYLLDDPFSAVDAKVGQYLYQKCVKEFLIDAICLLITHQIHLLSDADNVMIMENGRIKQQGSLKELKARGFDFLEQLQKTEEADKEVKHNEEEDLDENQDYEEDALLPTEDRRSGAVKLSHYLIFLRSGGGICNALLMLAVFICAYAIASFSDYYLSQCSRESNREFVWNYIYITFGVIALGICHTIYSMIFFTSASANLHKKCFSRIVKAEMNFFTKNSSGAILNRFSKDLGNTDEYIPLIATNVLTYLFITISALTLTLIVNVWILLPIFGLLVGLYTFRRFYIQTSRSLMRIQSLRRNPVFSHTNASIQGLTTIRSFSVAENFLEQFDDYQNRHSSAWLLLINSNRCFGYWVDTGCGIFVASILVILLHFGKDLNGGNVGLVITQLISIVGILQFGIRQWSEMDNQMICVERLLEYSEITTEENDTRLLTASPDWPEQGLIEFHDVSLTYHQDPVLQNINFRIKPREKIGIVGRTGAGKSSTISALFQLYPTKGQITIDGIDITKLQLHKLRSKLSIIPQEPLLLTGTLRQNLDPFEEYDDGALWDVLGDVEMKNTVSELSEGLFSEVAEGGTNFSVGQRQLLCLARALLRNNKILVIDEATANIDIYTDTLIQKTIREKFADCTVLTIAHRLQTVIDSDKILVLDAGRVAEFDHPFLLLRNADGIFYNLVQAMGKKVASNLENNAKINYLSKFRNSQRTDKDPALV